MRSTQNFCCKTKYNNMYIIQSCYKINKIKDINSYLFLCITNLEEYTREYKNGYLLCKERNQGDRKIFGKKK